MPSTAAILATDNGGQSWSAQAVPPGLARLWAVTCPSDRDCQAVGQSPATLGAAIGTTDGGATWVTEPLPASITMLRGVACAGAADCSAADARAPGGAGVILRWAA